MGKTLIPPEPAEVHEVMLRDALEERYLAYALSTIMHRALPDARDGLKPVHRRILYGMRLLRLDPGSAFKKSAKIVGDVMGSFHPHGDQAIYDAALHLIEKPEGRSKTLLKWVKGPDFPTGGVIVDSKEEIAEAYATGRGSFRTRARWKQEEGSRGTWVIVITEIPWMVQKSRLVEKIAELLNEKKLALVGDVRDESAEDVRLVIEPKSRAVDPELLMESLFRLTALESRISLNLNVLMKGKVPKVVGLAECLREWLDHLRDVLVARSNFRKGQTE